MKSYLDFERDIKDLEAELEKLKDPFNKDGISEVNTEKISQIQKDIDNKIKDSYKNLDDYQKVQVARHEDRPKSLFYIENLFTNFIKLSGDRSFGEDESVICGFGVFEGRSVCIIGQERGDGIEGRMRHNFGMVRSHGYRKVSRIVKLADRFNLPIFTFVDCAGADASPDSENTGIFESIASSIQIFMEVKVPIISILIGSGGSGGALAIASANKVIAMSGSIYSVISPEGAASILFRDSTKSAEAAKSMKLTANKVFEMGLVDEIVEEDIPAHRNRQQIVSSVRTALVKSLDEFKNFTREEIFEHRKEKFKNIGKRKSFIDLSSVSEGIRRSNLIPSTKKILLKFKKSFIIIALLILSAVLFLF